MENMSWVFAVVIFVLAVVVGVKICKSLLKVLLAAAIITIVAKVGMEVWQTGAPPAWVYQGLETAKEWFTGVIERSFPGALSSPMPW